MRLWELITFLRFEAFPFIPDAEKRRPIRQLLEMDVQHPVFQTTIKPLVNMNQWVGFCKALRDLRKHKWIGTPRFQFDTELFEALFWSQSSPFLACKMAEVLLQFPTLSFPKEWEIGTNLLLRSTSTNEVECVLQFMETYLEL